MGNSVEAPPTPDEPDGPKPDRLVEQFEAIGRIYAQQRMRQSRLLQAMLSGLVAGVSESEVAGSVARRDANGCVNVAPDVCPDCGEKWNKTERDWFIAPDSVISAVCPKGHRWRFAAEKLTNVRRSTENVKTSIDRFQDEPEHDDGNGMFLREPLVEHLPYSGAGNRRVRVDGVEYGERHCMTSEKHVPHPWPPVAHPVFWCDGEAKPSD